MSVALNSLHAKALKTIGSTERNNSLSLYLLPGSTVPLMHTPSKEAAAAFSLPTSPLCSYTVINNILTVRNL